MDSYILRLYDLDISLQSIPTVYFLLISHKSKNSLVLDKLGPMSDYKTTFLHYGIQRCRTIKLLKIYHIMEMQPFTTLKKLMLQSFYGMIPVLSAQKENSTWGKTNEIYV